MLGHVSRKLLHLQCPSTDTVPTVVTRKMGSNGTKFHYGPFRRIPNITVGHLNGR